jgi:hypothetical protein
VFLGQSSLSVYKLYFLHCLCGVFVAGAVLLLQGNSPASPLPLNTSAASIPLVLVQLATATTATLAILASIQLLGANTSPVLEISYPLVPPVRRPHLAAPLQRPVSASCGGRWYFYLSRAGQSRRNQASTVATL